MTILSKKKSIQGKSTEVEASESSSHHSGPHSHTIALSSLPSHNQIAVVQRSSEERLNSPQCWPHNAREEKRTSHSGSSHFEDYDSKESGGPSVSKRRHRASPLRNLRSSSKLREWAGSSPKAGPSCLEDDACTGYNSGDEYDVCPKNMTAADWLERDRIFEKRMRKRGLTVKAMGEDGACLFRAVADQVYGDQEMHNVVRKHCMDYIAANADYFSQYVTEDFTTYVNRKRLDNVHGNHIEVQAMCEMYNRSIEVFCYGKEPINIFHGMYKNDNEPIRLSYQRGSHYNSLVDPHKATVGVGLGLPSFNPGSADKNLLREVQRQSEDIHIEQTMLEDKLLATDWEATNEAIEEQVARESYLQWLRDTEKRNKAMGQTASGSSSATVTSPEARLSPRTRSTAGSEKGLYNEASSSQTNSGIEQTFPLIETASSFLNKLPSHMFGLTDADILAQVMAVSQQEYLDKLKKNKKDTSEHSLHFDFEHGGPSTST